MWWICSEKFPITSFYWTIIWMEPLRLKPMPYAMEKTFTSSESWSIEPCGIHSGDSNATLPVFNLGEFVMQQIKDHTHKIALALKTKGLINIQYAIKNDKVYVIEANLELQEQFRLSPKRITNPM